MKTKLFLLIATVLFGLLLSSCNKKDDDDKDDDNANQFNIPTLNFEYSVTGSLDRHANFTSPENSNTKGKHNHGVISMYSSAANTFSISGNGPDYTYTLTANMTGGVSKGTFTLAGAGFGTSSEGTFGELQSGTLILTEASLNYSTGTATYYKVSGNFTATIRSSHIGSTDTITFSGSFTGLHVAAS